MGTLHRLERLGQSLKDDLDEADAVQVEYDKTLEALRADIQILEEVTVPGLVEANRTVLERQRADTSLQVRRRVSTTIDVDKEV